MIKHLQAKFWNWVWNNLEIQDFVDSRIGELEDTLRCDLASAGDIRDLQNSIDNLESRIDD